MEILLRPMLRTCSQEKLQERVEQDKEGEGVRQAGGLRESLVLARFTGRGLWSTSHTTVSAPQGKEPNFVLAFP